MSWSRDLLKHARAMRKMAEKVRLLAKDALEEHARLLRYARDLDREAAILEAMAGGVRKHNTNKSRHRKKVSTITQAVTKAVESADSSSRLIHSPPRSRRSARRSRLPHKPRT